jgi:3D (Asp-Asp-Asp) domain-containing protein
VKVARIRRSLAAIGLLVAVAGSGLVQAQESMQVTVTHYADSGVTYSGGQTRPGVAACSWNIPMYSTIRFQDGREVRCEDRGQLGSSGWIDLWVGDVATARQMGRYTATVEITRP